jgi:hypothetical protein
MKKALIVLYVIVAVQAVVTAVAFSLYQSVVKDGLAEAGMELVSFCDDRYVHQQ